MRSLMFRHSFPPVQRLRSWAVTAGAIFIAIGISLFSPADSAWSQTNDNDATVKSRTIRVFILAGQSNMAGHGVVDLDDPENYNGGKGNLEHVIQHAQDRDRYAHLKDASGKWRVRDDVWVWHDAPGGLKAGPLTIGFTNYSGEPHHFGPELQIGHVLGDAFDEPVLLIKTAWGGKSLFRDFRPPSSPGELGSKYMEMFEQIGYAMENAPSTLAGLRQKKPVISGFIWQQGWNDMIDDEATAEYEMNLLHFIQDVRRQLNEPELPFVYGELGNGGKAEASAKMLAFREAQAKAAQHGDRNLGFVPTAAFARDAQSSPNLTHLHHWYGNAESYFLIGDALGKRMVRLIRDKEKPRVLILGDSISIGYTPFVKTMLEDEAVVLRPMLNEKRPENCAGTDSGLENIDRWLQIDGGNWDVIHFNWGLHDLKHVDSETGKNSNDPNDPLQTPPEEYGRQMRQIVARLKQTKANLICCLTTPVPAGCKPLRETDSPRVYNQIATKIAIENGIEINDLFTFAEKRLDRIQQPANVHFTREGSKILAEQVARAIRQSLTQPAPSQ
jgi:hypothetical protein